MRRTIVRCLLCLSLVMLVSVACGSSPPHVSVFTQDGKLYNAGLWSPNGRWLAAEGDEDGVITLFSASGQLVGYFHVDCEIAGEDEGVAWLPDGRLSCFTLRSPTLLHIFSFSRSERLQLRTTLSLPVPRGDMIDSLQWNPRHFWLAILANPTDGDPSPMLYITDGD